MQATGISSTIDKQLLVFSDLDGTLLDHDTYEWQAASPALDALKRCDTPLLLVSSKTLAELEVYRAQLDLRHPVVAENGAAIQVPAGYFGGELAPLPGTKTRSELQSAYESVKREFSFQCEAFYELGVAGIIRETGLTDQQAVLANERTASEPVLWLDSDARASEFADLMRARGLRCIRGGRFMHLMGETDKAAAVKHLLAAYARKWPDRQLLSVSLGDGPNDLGMLASTDIAVIIPGKHPHPMDLESQNSVLRPTLVGPSGWNEAMLSVLAEYQLNDHSHTNGD